MVVFSERFHGIKLWLYCDFKTRGNVLGLAWSLTDQTFCQTFVFWSVCLMVYHSPFVYTVRSSLIINVIVSLYYLLV